MAKGSGPRDGCRGQPNSSVMLQLVERGFNPNGFVTGIEVPENHIGLVE